MKKNLIFLFAFILSPVFAADDDSNERRWRELGFAENIIEKLRETEASRKAYREKEGLLQPGSGVSVLGHVSNSLNNV